MKDSQPWSHMSTRTTDETCLKNLQNIGKKFGTSKFKSKILNPKQNFIESIEGVLKSRILWVLCIRLID